MKSGLLLIGLLGLAGLAGQASAQDAAALHLRGQAAACAACHGTDGRPVQGSVMAALAGMPKSDFLAQMRAFREGTRPATVMHQLVKGLTDAQLEQLATYFAGAQR